MPANLGNSAVTTGLEKVCFHSSPKERECEVVQSCPTLCDPMDCSLPGSSVHGIFQTIVLEWIAISFSRGSSRPRNRTWVSRIVDRRFTVIDMETGTDFILGGSKITADGDCSHEIKRHLLLGRKVMTNLDSILKSRDITNKGPSGQGYGFSSSHVWM